MALFVDECRWPWRGRRWCHLISGDSTDELHAFAVRLGLPRQAFQGDHYDLDEPLRSGAIHQGAQPIGSRDLIRLLRDGGMRMRPGKSRPPTPSLPVEHASLVLARLHSRLPPGARITLASGGGVLRIGAESIEPGPSKVTRTDLLVGAGFSATGERLRTLPDTVGPGMRALVCGLNPSLVAADAGYGFSGPTNRFWKAAVAAGMTDRPADPWWALVAHGVGMTDLVKRATPRSSELRRAEYSEGAQRVSRLVARHEPGVVIFVGLEGWRAAVDRRAVPGWQSGGFAGRPAYVLPSTSGLNARVRLDELVAHLRAATAPCQT